MADKRIKGITIEIDGETKKLNEALKDVNKQIATSNAELKDLRSALKLDPKNTELLAQKQEVLAKEIKATTDRLNTLKQAQKDMGDYNSLTEEQKENYRALSAEISRTESSLKSLNKEFKESSKFSLEKLNDSLSGVREKSTQLVKDMAKVGIAITGVITTLGVASIKAYAEYEQLVGGVETLFKTSADEIKQYAQNAYKTAGLSANQYMETVTSFSASLIQSLRGDTQKATKYADMAIIDMADNANKMGTSIESIQNAYQGFAKQNYTMLDNLKLGYGGTKTEMERLIKDANRVKEANGEMANLSINSFADMVEAIHIIQNEMGITGTTAKEADSTILGSVNSMKASWQNLLNAVADDSADMETAVNNFVESTITAGKNIVPRIRVAIDGIKKLFNSLVRDVFPKLKREIPELKPLINLFEWFIDHKNLVITAIKAIIGAFVVTKIVDFATKIKSATTAIINFASGSVIGTAVTAIGALVGAVEILSSVLSFETEEQRKARIELEKHIDSMKDNVSTWNDLQEAQQETLNTGMSELSYYDKLYKELQDITDENGKVQEGYEKRAEFIVGQLSKAFDIEIEYQDGIIKNNEEIGKSIEDLMRKKKAQIILESQTDIYKEAYQKQDKAFKDMKALEEDYQLAHDKWQSTVNDINKNGNTELKFIMEGKKKLYEQAKDQYDSYAYAITTYESNLQEFEAGHYDNLETRTWEYIKTLEEANDKELQEIKDKLEKAQYDYEWYNKKFEETQDEKYKIQRDSAKRILDEQKNELDKYKSAISNAKTGVIQSAEFFISGFEKGISNQKNSLYIGITNLANGIVNKLKSALKISSPSKETMQIGDYFMQGLEVGIKKDTNSLLNQVDELGNSLIGNLYSSTQMAMNGLGGMMSTSLNPTINPSVAYDLNYKLMANAMKEALREVEVELDDRQVGRFIDKTISEEVFN